MFARAACTTCSEFSLCWQKTKLLRAFQICQRMYAIVSKSNKPSLFFNKSASQVSILWTPWKCIVMLTSVWDQIACVQGHNKNRCSIVFGTWSLHIQHTGSDKMCLLWRFSFVANALLHTDHRKDRNLGVVFIFQIPFHSLRGTWKDEEAWFWLFLLCCDMIEL